MRPLLAATLPAAVLAHYNFVSLIVNGAITDPYQFVRKTTNHNSPITDVTSPDLICNQGGLDADIMARTATHPVAPSDEVGFVLSTDVHHPGPLAVYMSRAPDGTDAAAYDGSGDWFKVYELTTSPSPSAGGDGDGGDGVQWATAGITNFTFALPGTLPAGDYLMRAEQIGLHNAKTLGGAQFYIGCAQLTVAAVGSAPAAEQPPPPATVKIPGVYDGHEPGILINIWHPVLTSYTVPGPPAWPGACEDHTPNVAGQASDGDCSGSEPGAAPSTSPSSSSSAAAAGSSSAAVPARRTRKAVRGSA